jgi:hypothetical protein
LEIRDMGLFRDGQQAHRFRFRKLNVFSIELGRCAALERRKFDLYAALFQKPGPWQPFHNFCAVGQHCNFAAPRTTFTLERLKRSGS